MLESLGYTVRACDTPAEALRLLETSPRAFDLLLTDVMMPDMSGPDLVRRALAVRPDLPHLYMSGYAANLIAGKGVRNTGAGFLQKPFSRIQIAQKIRDILGRHPSA
jgi:CheY-like chemotaxis protein